MPHYSVGEVARNALGGKVPPNRISQALYHGELNTAFAPMVGGRRMIDERLVPEIILLFRRKGFDVQEPESSTRPVALGGAA